DANDAFVTLTRSFAGFDLGLTPNQRAVGTALDQAGSSPSADIQSVLDALQTLTADQAPNALDQLGRDAHRSFATAQPRGRPIFAIASAAPPSASTTAPRRISSSAAPSATCAATRRLAACRAAPPRTSTRARSMPATRPAASTSTGCSATPMAARR